MDIFNIISLFFAFFWIVVLLASIAGSIFWIFMIIDVIKRKFPKEDDRIIWILVVILGGLVGAIVYYFMIKKKDKK